MIDMSPPSKEGRIRKDLDLWVGKFDRDSQHDISGILPPLETGNYLRKNRHEIILALTCLAPLIA
jgi:hypothetical protein